MFSAEFLKLLVIVALTWTGIGALALLLMLFKDWKNKELW
jgi:hypothetical protein